MRTFHIQTLGCKVNQYETEQMASVLRSRGLSAVDEVEWADLRIVNSCSVTIQAASKSRQATRQMIKLPVLSASTDSCISQPQRLSEHAHQRVIVTGCWATSDRAEAEQIPGVSAVITHHQDVAAELNRLIGLWQAEDQPPAGTSKPATVAYESSGPVQDEGWMIQAGTPDDQFAVDTKSRIAAGVNKNPAGTTSLPLLLEHQDAHQRAFLKVQDGCDAHCTYCIIPRLRPRVWSKPIEGAVDEARQLVASGHLELVLTGIFLGAYGQKTALRRRQEERVGDGICQLVEALCTRVPGLKRLRLSSLEPGDLTPRLIDTLRSHPQPVPHFHLPLQSGSDVILRRMNRQYGRDDFLNMVDRVERAFDRPALTTDIIIGFPGETQQEFGRTVEVVDRARFIHIHAFAFSPRPGTAAARWKRDFVRGPVVAERIDRLRAMAEGYSLEYRRQFVGRTLNVLVERPERQSAMLDVQNGRTDRYFAVHFDGPLSLVGKLVQVRIDRISGGRTFGARVGVS